MSLKKGLLSWVVHVGQLDWSVCRIYIRFWKWIFLLSGWLLIVGPGAPAPQNNNNWWAWFFSLLLECRFRAATPTPLYGSCSATAIPKECSPHTGAGVENSPSIRALTSTLVFQRTYCSARNTRHCLIHVLVGVRRVSAVEWEELPGPGTGDLPCPLRERAEWGFSWLLKRPELGG